MACCRTKCLRPWTPDLLEVILMKWRKMKISFVFYTNLMISMELPRSLREVTGLLFSPISWSGVGYETLKGKPNFRKYKSHMSIVQPKLTSLIPHY